MHFSLLLPTFIANLAGKILFDRDCSRDAPFTKDALATNYHMGPSGEKEEYIQH